MTQRAMDRAALVAIPAAILETTGSPFADFIGPRPYCNAGFGAGRFPLIGDRRVTQLDSA
jgi:hypothetical protein